MFRLGIEIPPAAKLLMLQASARRHMRLLVIFVSLRQWLRSGVFVLVIEEYIRVCTACRCLQKYRWFCDDH